MKTLFLKTGVKLTVEVGILPHDIGHFYIYEGDLIVYSVIRTASAGVQVHLPENTNVLLWHQLYEAHEITENFNQYFNLLNQ